MFKKTYQGLNIKNVVSNQIKSSFKIANFNIFKNQKYYSFSEKNSNLYKYSYETFASKKNSFIKQ
jgi:hypothetical protein